MVASKDWANETHMKAYDRAPIYKGKYKEGRYEGRYRYKGEYKGGMKKPNRIVCVV